MSPYFANFLTHTDNFTASLRGFLAKNVFYQDRESNPDLPVTDCTANPEKFRCLVIQRLKCLIIKHLSVNNVEHHKQTIAFW